MQMKLPVAGFEWDEGNVSKCRKHGLAIPEIEAFLLQDGNRIVADFKHSGQQEHASLPPECSAGGGYL
jgi:uncharacterized DUF497 family protein